jgi:NTP pyrophosphatase (non-canonical NTP hydrolase)
MKLTEYQDKAMETAMDTALNPAYMIANLTAEAGEVAGKYAKWIRDGVQDDEGLFLELGDVLWQVAGVATVMGWRLDEVAYQNLNKLASRKQRNALSGSGDAR